MSIQRRLVAAAALIGMAMLIPAAPIAFALPDTDADGLEDWREQRAALTDPKRSDTDHDGLSDGREVMNTSTDLLKADSDGDG